VADGSRYVPGQTLQVGWIINRIQETQDGLLTPCEPDFSSLPIAWDESVTTTLSHLRLQKDTCSSFGIEVLHFPSMLQSGLVGVDVISGLDGIVMERLDATDDTDSGWFLGSLQSQCDYADPAMLRRCSLYELAIQIPHCIQFLALPIGSRVECCESMIQFELQGAPIAALPESLVARLIQKPDL